MAPLEVKTGMIRMTNMITDKTKYLIQHTDEKFTIQSTLLQGGHQKIAIISIFYNKS